MPTLKGSVETRRETTALNRVRLPGSGFLVDLPGWKPEIFWVSLLDSDHWRGSRRKPRAGSPSE